MGEAKRRKKLDPMYGKIPSGRGNSERLQAKLFQILVSGRAKEGYRNVGKGFVFIKDFVELADDVKLSDALPYIPKEVIDSYLKGLQEKDTLLSPETSFLSLADIKGDSIDFLVTLKNALEKYDPNKQLVSLDPESRIIATIDLAEEEVEMIEQLEKNNKLNKLHSLPFENF